MAFSLTSTYIGLNGVQLYALCKTVSGNKVESSINLNDCIANINADNGVLTWAKGGDFAATSVAITLNGTVLHAQCKHFDGSLNSSQLDLDERISNNNGQLSF